MTTDDLLTVIAEHADALAVRVHKHRDNPVVLAQIARTLPAALHALVAEMRAGKTTTKGKR